MPLGLMVRGVPLCGACMCTCVWVYVCVHVLACVCASKSCEHKRPYLHACVG